MKYTNYKRMVEIKILLEATIIPYAIYNITRNLDLCANQQICLCLLAPLIVLFCIIGVPQRNSMNIILDIIMLEHNQRTILQELKCLQSFEIIILIITGITIFVKHTINQGIDIQMLFLIVAIIMVVILIAIEYRILASAYNKRIIVLELTNYSLTLINIEIAIQATILTWILLETHYRNVPLMFTLFLLIMDQTPRKLIITLKFIDLMIPETKIYYQLPEKIRQCLNKVRSKTQLNTQLKEHRRKIQQTKKKILSNKNLIIEAVLILATLLLKIIY